MKNFLFLSLLCCLSYTSLAQRTPWDKDLLITVGPSIPYNDFAAKTFDYNAGFASAGANLESNFLWYGRWFGLEASAGYTNLFFARKAYRDEYDRFLENEGRTKVNAGNYHIFKSTAGFIMRVVEFEKTEIQLNLQAGIALNVHPEIEVTNTLWGTLNTVPKSYDWQSISSVGLKISHYVNEKYALVLNCNSNHTHPRFYDEGFWKGGFYLRIRYINCSLGILVKL